MKHIVKAASTVALALMLAACGKAVPAGTAASSPSQQAAAQPAASTPPSAGTAPIDTAATWQTASGAMPRQVEMYYFYDELCGSCDGTAEFDVMVQEIIVPIDDDYPFVIYRRNVYEDAGRAEFNELCAEMGLQAETLSFPLFIAGGKVFQGLETIESNLAEAYLVAGEDLFIHSTVYNPATQKTGEDLFVDYTVNPDAVTAVYFYRSVCEECRQTGPVIDAAPESIEAGGKTFPVEIVRINTRAGNNGERIAAFFEAYDVPDEDRMVPIVFLSAGYLAGYEEIAAHFYERLQESYAEPFVYG